MLSKSSESQNRRSDNINVNPALICQCGKPTRPHTFFCSDECRFWSKVNKGPGCWLWTGGKHTSGYGQFSAKINGKRRPIGAHVFSYHLTTGAPLLSCWVLHHCDVPSCVRPDHLFGGDHKANMEDAAAKGRLSVARPSKQKLTPADIYEVRRLASIGVKQVAIARLFNVSEAFISQIVLGKTRRLDAPMRPALEETA